MFQFRKFVKDVTGWSDRIARIKQRPIGKFGGGGQADGQCLVAGDFPVSAGRELRRWDPIVNAK